MSRLLGHFFVVAEGVRNLGEDSRGPIRRAAQAGQGDGCARGGLSGASCCCRFVGALRWKWGQGSTSGWAGVGSWVWGSAVVGDAAAVGLEVGL